MSELLVPFTYGYMLNAIWVSALVAALCAFLSAFLMLKGWSLIGDALSHAVVPGVAASAILGLPFAIGAFVAGCLAAATMMLLSTTSRLKQDTVIGLVLTSYFGLGLFMISIAPTRVDVMTITMGNVLAIAPLDSLQLIAIGIISLAVLLVLWRDILAAFFDETHARAIGLSPTKLKALFFALVAASCVAALQTVGAFLVIALLITPGATAYLLADRFSLVLIISVAVGASTAAVGAYLSFFLDGATGGVIVCLQTLLFIAAFLFAPKHGLISAKLRARRALENAGARHA